MAYDTDRQLEAARQAATIELLPTDCLSGEVAAFDVLVNSAYVGHWVLRSAGSSSITWTQSARPVDTNCDGRDEGDIRAAIRAILPAELL